ncbi:MAG: DNRLRE domain-containing protein, partial [Planctomycetota bacterium]
NAQAWTKTIGFEDGTVGNRAQSTADSFGEAGTDTLFSDAYSIEGSQSVKFHHIECSSGWAQAHAYFDYTDVPYGGEIWVRFYVYQKEPWSNSNCTQSGAQAWKMFRVQKGSEGYISAYGTSNGQPRMDCENCSPGWNMFQNVGTPYALQNDQWECVEFYIKLHDSDGIVRMWINGELKLEYTDQHTANVGTSANWSYVYTYWNDGIPQDQDSYMDAIVVTNETPSQQDSYGNYMIGPIGGPQPPGQAGNPDPTNGATDVSVGADLSWTAGTGATSHDVYFGTDPTPDSGEFQGNQEATTFDTGSMNNSTTYYWRINEVSTEGTTTGNIWSFTTEAAGSPPGQASNPGPADGATYISVNADLSWTAGSSSDSSNVYFGTDPTPDSNEFMGNQTATTFDPNTLANDTTYYWRIDEVNTYGTTTGTVWNFTTQTASGGTVLLVNFGATAGQNTFDLAGWNTIIKDTYTDYRAIGPGGTTIVVGSNGGYDFQGLTGTSRNFAIDEKIVVTWYNNSGSQITFTPKMSFTDSDRRDASWYDMTQAVINAYGTGTSEFTVDASSDGTYSLVNVNCNYDNNQVLICDKIELVTGSTPPGQATSPSPGNGAADITVDADLSWTAGSGATSSDVYFGTTSPGAFQGNQTATTFDTGTMTNNTTYYWRIDEVNTAGTTTGTVWSFTTIVAAPGQATSPSPTDSATEVSVTADLSWTAGSGTTSHDVYFGTDSTPDSGELQGNQTVATFDPGTMDANTTYYWRIDQINSGGTTTGTVWSFTTISAGGTIVLVDFGATQAQDTFELTNWDTAITDIYTNNVDIGPDGTTITVGNNEGYDYQGVTGTSRNFAIDEKIVVTWYNNSGSQITFTPKMSFTDSDRRDASWYDMTQAVINAYGTGTSEFTVDGDSDGNYSVVNVNCNYSNNQVLICDKIELITGSAPPGQASSPSPGNSATGVSITADLSWTAGSGATSHDVYFGTTSPGASQGNQTATTFDTGTMTNNTTYYWRIDQVNAQGTTTGDVWSFTTIVAAPSQATSPSPSNSATGVSITADLSWTAGSGATSHDVYFGTASPGAFQGNQAAATFNTGTMPNDTTHYWRIDEVNAGGTTTGTVWTFTTIVAAPAQATNPNPTNSATDISIYADLSWASGSGATSHDVYFGTSSPGTSQGNQTATTFDTGTMSNNTTYYWRIDQVNAGGTTTGMVWNFTTEAAVPPPGQASNPNPPDSAADVSIDADLSWTAGSDSTSSDVYFGTDSTPDSGELQGNQTATTFEPGTLENDTTYYWRIDEVNTSGTTTGVVWSFTIEAAPAPVTKEFGDAVNTDYPGTIEDTFANSGAASTNYSTYLTLNTYTWPADTIANTTIIKWDLTDIPTDANVTEATLYLYQVDSSGDSSYDIGVHKITGVDPNITACTWNTYDGTNSWTGGSDGGQSDIAAAEDTKSVNLTDDEYKTWDVTDMVTDWVATPSSNYGMLVNSDDDASVDSYRFFAANDANDSSTRPKLIVTYGGSAPNDVEIIGSWGSGTTHTEESGTNRALIFIAHAESSADTSDLGSVTYGGQSMTKVVERNMHYSYSAYTCAFILDEDGIDAATSSTFSPSWNTLPSGTPAYTSVFLQNVNQTTLVGATGTGGTSTTTAQTSALSTNDGDMAIVAGTCGNDATYSTINSFTEAIEVAPSSADGIGGYLSCTGANVTPGVSHTNVNRQSVIGFVVQTE